jgi:hypothetical protein
MLLLCPCAAASLPLPLQPQAKLYPRLLAAMKPGATLGLSHGFLLGVMQNDGVDFRKDINVVLVAPKVGDSCFLEVAWLDCVGLQRLGGWGGAWCCDRVHAAVDSVVPGRVEWDGLPSRPAQVLSGLVSMSLGLGVRFMWCQASQRWRQDLLDDDHKTPGIT